MSVPAWVGVLQAAEVWGCPPWEITGESPPRRLLWLFRRVAHEQETARAARTRKAHYG